MANYEASWDFPQYSAYSILNVINPAICWNAVQNNPLIKGFEVDFLDMEDMQWRRIGETNVSFIQFPSDIYVGESLYLILKLVRSITNESLLSDTVALSKCISIPKR